MKTLIKWIRNNKEILIVSVIALFFIVCIFFASRIDIRKRNSDLKLLEKQYKIEKKHNLELQKQINDSLAFYRKFISPSKANSIQVKTKQQIIINEKIINSIRNLDTDSTIVLLAKYLSLQGSN